MKLTFYFDDSRCLCNTTGILGRANVHAAVTDHGIDDAEYWSSDLINGN